MNKLALNSVCKVAYILENWDIRNLRKQILVKEYSSLEIHTIWKEENRKIYIEKRNKNVLT